MTESVQFTTVALKEWIEKEANTSLIPVQAQAKKLLDETSQAIAALNEVCESLLENSNKEIEKRNMKLYNRARALNKLANLFIDRLAKLSMPEQITYDTLRKYNSESQKTLLVTEVDIKNWFPRISPFFIMDRRKFLTVYDKTKQTFLSLNEFVNKEYVKIKTLQETLLMIGELQGLENKFTGMQVEIENIKNERVPVEAKIAELEQKTGELKTAGPIDQLNFVTCEIETLNNDLKTTLRHLQKPFIKMQALATSGGGGGITPDELRLINLYLDTPFEALVIEETGCPTLKRVLEKLQIMLKEDKLKLKPDKARKAEQSLTEILDKSLLNDPQEKSKTLSTQKDQLLTSTRMDEIKQNISMFEDQTEQLKARKASIEAHETIKKREHQDLQSDLSNRKRAIERNIAEAFTKTIKIT
ncbi:MAG: hypothetical protein FWD52_02655 [Candidatus Bathyarchaeota archaeon]|nr:hypothetical protein [Candidatus Termiticorpusculum sp.]